MFAVLSADMAPGRLNCVMLDGLLMPVEASQLETFFSVLQAKLKALMPFLSVTQYCIHDQLCPENEQLLDVRSLLVLIDFFLSVKNCTLIDNELKFLSTSLGITNKICPLNDRGKIFLFTHFVVNKIFTRF